MSNKFQHWSEIEYEILLEELSGQYFCQITFPT